MKTFEKTVEVKVPVRTAYNQWTQFEEFPEFMDGVEKVVQEDDTRLHWVTEIGGQQREFDATITEQTPDQRIAWNAEGDVHQAGVVTFHKLDDTTTRVMLQMKIDPEGFAEKAAEMLGIIQRRVDKDMDNFKSFIESRGAETGAWRGEVEQDT